MPGFAPTDLAGRAPGATQLYRAGLLLPVDSPPIADAALAVADGRILALGPAAEILTAYPDAPVVNELPGGVIMPGLVNAHCHLGLSLAQGVLPPDRDFTAWIGKLLPLRQSWTAAEHRLSLHLGLRETLRGGCTLMGEILTESETGTAELLEQEAAPLRLRAYREGLGRLPAHQETVVTRFRSTESVAPDYPAPGELRFGFSPHAPYTVDPELFSTILDLASEQGFPLCTHAAETEDETHYMAEGAGSLADLLRRIGWETESTPLWNGGRGLVDWLDGRGGGTPLMIVHGTWLNPEEIATLARRDDAFVAYCPGSVAWFHGGEDPHPVVDMLAAGLPVTLGTDSLASSPTLNMPLTCTLARRAHPELEPEQILGMATLNGAAALGFPELGRLAKGSPADFLLFDLPGVSDSARLSAAEAVEGSLLSGYRVPNLHVVGGIPHAFAALRPFPA
jgi:aminodeoxyfutalosine deaminase